MVYIKLGRKINTRFKLMNNKKSLFVYFMVFLVILALVFRSMILGISTNLFNWTEYPYVIWLVYQGIGKLGALNFLNFGMTSAFFPAKNSYFYSDLYLPQAMMGLPLSTYIYNPILVFNIIFLLTFILNYFSLYLFWSIWFKKAGQRFLASVVFIFSPFFQLQLEHFQMLSYWPLFFSLYFLFKEKSFNLFRSVLSGVFLIIQFLTSVYLSVYLVFIMLLKTVLEWFNTRKIQIIKSFLVTILVFLVGAGFFIFSYIEIKNTYKTVRDYNDYVDFSADISDYIFTSKIDSLASRLDIIKKWNSFDKHSVGEFASFTGLALFLSGLFYLIKINIKNKKIYLGLSFKFNDLFFILLLFFGLVFSFGPELNFNGYHSGIPTFYGLLIRYVPFLEVVRSLSRWSFLFYLALTYFFVRYLSNKKRWVLVVFISLFFLENLPLFMKAKSEDYIDVKSDLLLKEACKNDKQVLLEIPTGQLTAGDNPLVGHNFIAKRQLATVYHGCNMVNGYSGFESSEQRIYLSDLNMALKNKESAKFLDLLKQRNVSFLRFTPELVAVKDRDDYIYSINSLVKSGKVIKESDNLYKVN